VRALVETHALVGDRGAYRLAKDFATLVMPTSVQPVLAARVDRLPPEEKRLLQIAAVIGKDVAFGLLCAIADLPEDALRRGLAQLQGAEFLYEAKLFPDLEYTFKHALTHEVTYGSILQENRRALHARIVAVIERIYADRLVEYVERLAHHAVRGEAWGKAHVYSCQAGVKAIERSAYAEAVAFLGQALDALRHLPETRETLEQEIDLRFDLRNPLFALGQPERGLQYISEAEALATKLQDQRRLGWASLYTAHHLWMTGRATESATSGKNALTIAEALEDFSLRVGAYLYLGGSCFISGDYRNAEHFLRKTIQLLPGDLSHERCGLTAYPAVISRAFLVWTLANLGKFEEGAACGGDGIRLAEDIDHPYSLAGVYVNLAWLYLLKGESTEALHVCQRGLALARERALTLWVPFCEWFLGYQQIQSGHGGEGLASMEQALKGIESMSFGGYQPLLLVHLGEACLLENRLDEAKGFGQRALTLCREHQQRGHEAYALRLQAEIATHKGACAEGEVCYGEALALAEDRGMNPLVAHCHLGLGKLCWRTDHHERTQEHLIIAAKMYREMGMKFHLKQAEAWYDKCG
jgi:tetratricopeptide (TPR) repeat protein